MLSAARHGRLACMAAVLSFFASGVLAASPDAPSKPPPRLPSAVSETNRIPTGVDTGSPATSANLPLGTPVPPANSVDRSDINKRSAAARVATRPRISSAPVSSIGDRVPAGPAALGANTSARDPGATATPAERKPAPR